MSYLCQVHFIDRSAPGWLSVLAISRTYDRRVAMMGLYQDKFVFSCSIVSLFYQTRYCELSIVEENATDLAHLSNEHHLTLPFLLLQYPLPIFCLVISSLNTLPPVPPLVGLLTGLPHSQLSSPAYALLRSCNSTPLVGSSWKEGSRRWPLVAVIPPVAAAMP